MDKPTKVKPTIEKTTCEGDFRLNWDTCGLCGLPRRRHKTGREGKQGYSPDGKPPSFPKGFPKADWGWKPGQSGNPKGRPREGESWAAVIKRISSMDADEIAVMVGKDNELGQQLMQLPKGVAMKELVTARVLASLMFEPTPGLWNGLMERAEGRVPLAVDITTLALDASTVEAKILELYERAKTRALLEDGNMVDGEVVKE